jgi:hypothetical protein
MCNHDGEHQDAPSVGEAMDNLRQPMPLGRKLALLVRNNYLKLRRGSNCCGNYGQPGC